MRTQHATTESCARRASQSGFTLVELTVVVVIIGVLAAMGIPSFQNAIRQSRADVAGANLRAVWAAERLYWLEYHEYTDKLAAQTPPSPPGLVDLGLLDPAMFDNVSGNYLYSVTPDAAGYSVGFTATATSRLGDITITINDSGVVTVTGITLGF